VVFGRACRAASTTLQGEKTYGRIVKNMHITKTKITKYAKLSLETPPEALCTQKNTRGSPKTAQASQSLPKDSHEGAQDTPKELKGPQKTSKGDPSTI